MFVGCVLTKKAARKGGKAGNLSGLCVAVDKGVMG